ncbi:hypothetical protein C8T65DRAFT_595257, partial [Cerioporus squamosus]
GPSQHNDGKGISATLLFSHLPALSEGKPRKNAKLPTTTKVFAFHEDMELRDFLACAVNSLVPSHDDLLGKCKLWLDPTGSNLPPESATSLTVKFTVPRSAYQDVLVESEKDYKEMMGILADKSKPTVKISMQEHALPYDADDDRDYSNDDEKGRKSRKRKDKEKKKRVNTEVEQNDFILELEQKHQCNDTHCTHGSCLLEGPTADHLPLTPLLMSSWAAAKVRVALPVSELSCLTEQATTDCRCAWCRHRTSP